MGDDLEIWVCCACGKRGPSRYDVGDESCMLHSIRVVPETIETNERGRVRKADAYEGPGWHGGRPIR